MITIKTVVEEILQNDREAQNMLVHGLLNTTQYAKNIFVEVKSKTMKDPSLQTIVVTLNRLKRKLRAYDYLPEISIANISVHTPIIELIYEKNTDNIQKILTISTEIKKNNDTFFAISTSSRDIAVVISEKIEPYFSKKIKNYKKRKDNLCAVSLRFEEDLVEQAGIGYALMHKIAQRNIVLDEVFSTFNEFTLVLEKRFLSKTLSCFE